ncbi:MAG: hypothetical protein JWM80_1612 [Cyanobacteria bacterium RYN_339]|nr:hypothetical protein [Cyanobacteria bacterium RYN_339]
MRFALALVLTAACLALPARADGPLGKTDVFAGKGNFSHALRDGTRWDDRLRGFRLADGGEGYVKKGSFTLEDLHYGFGYDRVVPSWNADCPAGTAVMVELQASADSGKTHGGWYEVARWGDPALTGGKDTRAKKDDLGRINEDTLELKAKADRLSARVTLLSTRLDATPLVSLLALAVTDHTQTVKPDDSRGPAWGREVPADFRSQGWENADLSYRICGPTSTGMMLTSHGVHLPTTKVAEACWDDLNGIYGNWPFIAAGASQLMRRYADAIPPKPGHAKAFRSYVTFAPDWKLVEQEVLDGNPVVCSIHFGTNELKGSPTNGSDGHLILVRGFTKAGDVVVNDPAGRTPGTGRVVYNRRQLHAARHGGPVIVFHPYD